MKAGYWTRVLLAAIPTLLALWAFPALAASSTDFGYQTYFRHHPPRNKPVKHHLYPFPGPVIHYGQDIPVCAAARTEEAYANKHQLRYILHGKDGWLFRTIDFRTDFTANPQTMAYFSRLNKALAAKGQTLVAAFQPPRALVSAKHIDPADTPQGYTTEQALAGYQAFLKQLNDAGIKTVDLSHPPETVGYFAKGDFHWAPSGAAWSARKVAETLKELPAFGDIEQRDFETRAAGLGPADRGALEEFIQNTCKVNIALTSEPLWTTTEKASEKADAESLLGESALPGIAVVGTSNSAQDERFSFVGTLKSALRADVYNAALTAGGFGSSAYRYYASDAYREHPPKIILWEFLPQHNYNDAESANDFRQMIPALQGTCDEKKALANDTVGIRSAQTDLFKTALNRPLKNSYLYLEVTDPKERSLKLDILYADGNMDRVDFTRSTRMENNGKYYFELSDGADRKALFYRLTTDAPQGKITARICPYPVNLAEK